MVRRRRGWRMALLFGVTAVGAVLAWRWYYHPVIRTSGVRSATLTFALLRTPELNARFPASNRYKVTTTDTERIRALVRVLETATPQTAHKCGSIGHLDLTYADGRGLHVGLMPGHD